MAWLPILIGVYIVVVMFSFYYLISDELTEDHSLIYRLIHKTNLKRDIWVLFLYLLAALFWPVLILLAIFEDCF